MTSNHIKADPAPFPQGGELVLSRTALLIIDMQRDFCAADGYMHRLGCDLERLRAPIEPLRRVLDAARSAGLTVIHTREGYAPDLSDLQPWKKAGATNEAIGSRGLLGRALVRGEFGWDFIEELQPEPGEAVYDKASYGAFVTTTLGADLKVKGIDTAILTGVTTDCCITSTLREALDRGIDCMVVEDCVTAGSATRHEAALTIIREAGGVFGTLGRSEDVVAALAGN
jgi:nicotinamidase-related amidase